MGEINIILPPNPCTLSPEHGTIEGLEGGQAPPEVQITNAFLSRLSCTLTPLLTPQTHGIGQWRGPMNGDSVCLWEGRMSDESTSSHETGHPSVSQQRLST